MDLEPTFRQTLQQEPDNPLHYAVYGDWLQEQGDPRGQLIQFQLELEREHLPAGRQRELRRLVENLLFEHPELFLGGLTDWLIQRTRLEIGSRFSLPGYSARPGMMFEFARGFLSWLRIADCEAELLREVANGPATTLLRRLSIGTFPGGPTPSLSWQAAGYPESAPSLGNLRELDIGFQTPVPRVPEGGLLEWLQSLPRLRALRLRQSSSGPSIRNLIQHPLPQLTSLEISGHEFPPGGLVTDLLGNPALRQLRSLQLVWPETCLARNRHRRLFGLHDLMELTTPGALPELTHLGLPGGLIGDACCRELVDSGALRRLVSLDFRWGDITRVGVSCLAESPGNLREIRLHGNPLRPLDLEPLRRAAVRVDFSQ